MGRALQADERSSGGTGKEVSCCLVFAGTYVHCYSLKEFLSALAQVEAEEQADISESFEIEAVPAFVILRVCLHRHLSRISISSRVQGHTLLDRISGADASALTQSVAKHATTPAYNPLSRTDNAPAKAPTTVPSGLSYSDKSETTEELNQRLRGLMTQSQVVLFMKGSPEAPRCGFSRKISALLKDNNIQFAHFDILSDESVRQGTSLISSFSIHTLTLYSSSRVESVEQLAYFPPIDREWRAGWRPRYRSGNGGDG